MEQSKNCCNRWGRKNRFTLGVLFFSSILELQGCALHYYDSTTGTEHVWGFGHMAMKPSAPNEGLKAVGRRTDTGGISIARLQEGIYVALGWASQQRIEIMDDNTQLCLAWPTNTFYSVRVGSHFPPTLDDCTQDKKENVK